MESNVFAHSGEIGCICPGCCLGEPPLETANGPGGRNGGVSIAALKLAEFELFELIGNGRWTGAQDDTLIPQEQFAGRVSFPYDTDTGDADQGIDALLVGYAWNTMALTYSFPDRAKDYERGYGSEPHRFSELNPTQKNAADYSVAQYAAISGLTFEYWGDDAGEDDGDADLRFAETAVVSTAWGYYPSNSYVGGDTWYNPDNYNSPNVGTYAYHTFLHEVGHALGLKHGHETSGPGAVPDAYNSMEYTVMTYYSYIGTTANGYTNASDSYSQSLMMLDIAAIQRMYGANFSENAGNTTYTFSPMTGEMLVVDGGMDVTANTGLTIGNKIFRTIWDGNGVDTYDFSDYTTDLAVNLAPGEYVDLDVGGNFQRADLGNWYDPDNPFTYARGHIFNALQYEGDPRSLIENANGGSGNDEFFGNEADNVFDGNAGNDTFHGSDGSDTYFGDDGFDSVIYDALFSSFSFSVAGTFLQVIDSAIDWIAETVEMVLFSDESWTFDDLFGFASGASVLNAIDDDYTVGEGAVLSGDNLLSNDIGDSLIVSAVNGDAGNVGNQIMLTSGALLTVNAGGVEGSLTYDPNGAFNFLNTGESAVDNFTYEASDGSGGSDTATVSVTIEGDGAPPPPPPPPQLVVVGFEGETADQDGFIFTDTLLTTRAKGVTSGSQAGRSKGDTLSFDTSDSFDFDFESGYFTATDANRTTVTVTAYLNGVESESESFTIRKNKESFHKMDDAIFDNVDMIVITANGGVIIDDLTFTF